MLAAPAFGQETMDGGVFLTYDPGTASMEVWAYTNLDISDSIDYRVSVTVNVYRDGALDNDWSQSGFSYASVDQTFDTYPGVTYSATAEHWVYFEDLTAEGYLDPDEISLASFQNTGTSTFQLITNQEGDPEYMEWEAEEEVAETTADQVQTPAATLSVTTDGSFIVQNGNATVLPDCPGVDLKQYSPSSSGQQLPCSLFTSDPSSGAPTAPRLKTWLSSVGASIPIKWSAGLQFKRPDSGYNIDKSGNQIPHACNGQTGVASSVPTVSYSDSATAQPLSINGSDSSQKSYDITNAFGMNQPGVVQGGIMTLQWQIGNYAAQAFYLGLWGKNPEIADVRSYLQRVYPGAPWYAELIINHESSYHQFNVENGIVGTPNLGPPCGFGITQQDPPGQYASPYYRDVWNWQTNIDSGITEMFVKQTNGNKKWNDAMTNYDGDLSHVAPPCAIQIGSSSSNQTFCFDQSPIYANTVYSWADANSIKCYNGCYYGYLNYDRQYQWWFSSWSSLSRYPGYLNQVLGKRLPR
jgi:hypothetical protein